MPDRLDFIWSDLFGQSATMAQLVVLLFVASLILLLLSLVSFQLSRIRKPETDRGNSTSSNPSMSKASTGSTSKDQPVLRVSWGQIEDKREPQPTEAAARQMEPDIRFDKAHPRMAAASQTGGQPTPPGVSMEEMPLNVTYLNRNNRDSAGVVLAEQPTEGSRIGPLYFNQPKTAPEEETLAAKVTEQSEDSIDGFIIKQRSRRAPAAATHANKIDPEESSQFSAVEASAAAAPSFSMDRSEDVTLIELGKIEARMKQLKQFYQNGHISSAIYAEQSRQLFEEARRLMSKS